MGIKGLHGLLKSIQKPCHLKKFSGQTLGVDAYGWLHRGTVACAVDLVLDRPTTKHVDFVLSRVRMLLYFGISPYLVFDGDNLPSKSGTESDRYQKRQDSKALGMELQRKGRTAEAYQEFQKAVDVTPLMARQLIEELKKMDVQYVVAPYEADAQLVYLEQQGLIDGIISEDSDLLVFGAKCLISKLDQHGDCIEIRRSDFTSCREVSFVGWTDADFRQMCILSGCDYLPNIARMGLKTAYRSIRKYKTVEKALRMLQFDGQYRVPANYLQDFKQAELTFLYQRVFCPKAGKLVTLTIPDGDVKLEELPFIGGDMDAEIAVGVARGDLDPTTKKPLIVKSLGLSKTAANRLANSIHRRQTIGSSAELKPSKPINSFFTPKRVPLAELDPNSLTPSPNQQRLLERHANTSWESSPAPSRPLGVRSAPANAPSNRLSSPLSVKRQRLCSEADEASLTGTPDYRSRFFSQVQNESSPSGLKFNRNKKVRKSTLDVFSDDLAEDIMSQLPDPTQTVEKPQNETQELKVLSQPSEPTQGNGTANVNDESLPSTTGGKTDFAQIGPEENINTPTTSKTPSKVVNVDSDPQVFHQVLEYHIKRQNSAAFSKYAFKAGGNGVSPNAQRPDDCVAQKPPLRELNNKGMVEGPVCNKRLTPLQRLGQSALARSRSLDGLSASPPAWRSSTMRGTSSERVARGSRMPVSLRLSQGSEDWIAPDSEDEDHLEDDSALPAQSRLASLDLKRFSFMNK
ncbi:hypothetical protein AOCH_004792 [Aspergillus ochraceoroseus]|uniref:Uncharacterized protein n=1 Tax=Aspergillus ochraceoroseus TaxID=138278 RepID=A0A0F8UY17_9EURO|nr:hypothetical protein AOCH_004792 [Aspergillus ochraceoroseus]